MVSGSLCPLISILDVSFSVSFVVRGQRPRRGRWPMASPHRGIFSVFLVFVQPQSQLEGPQKQVGGPRGGERTDGRMDGNEENGENLPMWWCHRSSSPMGPLPKKQWLLICPSFPVADVSTPTPQTPLIQAAASGTKASEKKSARRPEIDYIRVGLTWGILLYHVIFVYLPAQFYIHDPFYDYANNTVGGTDVNDQWISDFSHAKRTF